MAAALMHESESEIVIQITVPKSGNFYECEENIQQALNEGGALATGRCLEEFDTDGAPLWIGNQKLTAKRTKVAKKYETPYGIAEVERYTYQSPEGGRVFVPMETNARIIGSSTPLFAKSVSYLYANNNAAVTKASLEQTTGRVVSRCYIQDISATVSEQVELRSRRLEYSRSEPEARDVAFVTVGIDGTCLLFCNEGYRQAMVGTLGFYDVAGERLHTNYVAAAPEHGKATFIKRMDEEIERTKRNYPEVRYVGISDGASDYLPWLKKHTTTQILDFWHVTEYLAEAAGAIHRSKPKRAEWLDQSCHLLKHQPGAAADLLGDLEEAETKGNLSKGLREKLMAALSYFGNNLDRMNYASYRRSKLPIGSGIMEAACKTVVKGRLCGSGMKWSQSGSEVVLTLRALSLTESRWKEFWSHLAKNGPTTA